MIHENEKISLKKKTFSSRLLSRMVFISNWVRRSRESLTISAGVRGLDLNRPFMIIDSSDSNSLKMNRNGELSQVSMFSLLGFVI